MSESLVPKVPRDGTLTLEDGNAGTPNTYTVQYSNAVSFTNTQTEAIHVFNRGTRVYTRKGNDGIPSFTFQVVFTSFTDGTSNTVIDAFEKSGACAAWVKQLATVEHYNLKGTFTIEGSDHSDDTDHSVICTGLRLTSWDFAEGDPFTATFSCEVLGTITYTGPS